MRMKTFFAAAVATMLTTLGAASPATAAAVTPHTKIHLLNAMHGEALAFAKYTAFAQEADQTGHPAVAALFRSTATQERDQHFTEEAAFVGLVGTQVDNLNNSIIAESYEATMLYRAYARQAQTDGNWRAARLFQELTIDEATHQTLLQNALKMVQGRGWHRCPTPPTVHAVTIIAGPAKAQGATLNNLRAAIRGEAFASAKYHLYAEDAASHDNTAVSRLFTALSDVERLEHLAALANLAGLVGDVRTDLIDAITGENIEATAMYPGYAATATAAGDTRVGSLFTEISGDEADHRDAYRSALAAL